MVGIGLERFCEGFACNCIVGVQYGIAGVICIFFSIGYWDSSLLRYEWAVYIGMHL